MNFDLSGTYIVRQHIIWWSSWNLMTMVVIESKPHRHKEIKRKITKKRLTASLRANVHYFLLRGKKDVHEAWSLIVLQYPAVSPEFKNCSLTS